MAAHYHPVLAIIWITAMATLAVGYLLIAYKINRGPMRRRKP
jgi:hypothetical protein